MAHRICLTINEPIIMNNKFVEIWSSSSTYHRFTFSIDILFCSCSSIIYIITITNICFYILKYIHTFTYIQGLFIVLRTVQSYSVYLQKKNEKWEMRRKSITWTVQSTLRLQSDWIQSSETHTVEEVVKKSLINDQSSLIQSHRFCRCTIITIIGTMRCWERTLGSWRHGRRRRGWNSRVTCCRETKGKTRTRRTGWGHNPFGHHRRCGGCI